MQHGKARRVHWAAGRAGQFFVRCRAADGRELELGRGNEREVEGWQFGTSASGLIENVGPACQENRI